MGAKGVRFISFSSSPRADARRSRAFVGPAAALMVVGIALGMVVGLVGPLLAGVAAQGPGSGRSGQGAEAGPEAWTDAVYAVELGPTLRTVRLDGAVAIHRFEATHELALVCGSNCSADELRQHYHDGGEAQRQGLVTAIEQSVEERAAVALGSIAGGPEDVVVQARVDNATLETQPDAADGPDRPPVLVDVAASAPVAALDETELSDDQVEALFEMGARVSMPLAVTVGPGENVTLRLRVPQPLSLLDAEGATRTTGNTSATWQLTNWKGVEPRALAASALTGRADVVPPAEPEAEVNVTLDLSDIEGNTGGLLGPGPTASVNVELSVHATIEALAGPSELPAGVRLPVLSAEAVRIGLAAGLIERNALENRTETARDRLADQAEAAFGGEQPVDGGLVNETLDARTTDESSPIEMLLTTNATLDVGGDAAVPAPAPANTAALAPVLALTLQEVTLPPLQVPALPGLGDAVTRLTIVLPPGTELRLPAGYDGAPPRQITTDDGHTAMVFSPQGDERAPAPLEGAVLVAGLGLAWHLFWPLIVLVLVALALGVGAAFWLVRRRGGRTPGEGRDGP